MIIVVIGASKRKKEDLNNICSEWKFLQNGKKGQKNAAVRQEIEEIKAGRGAPSSSAIGGKSSVSKRHQKKPRRGAEADMDDFEEEGSE